MVSAAGMKQTVKMLAEAQHRLSSYYLMKGMEGDADGTPNLKTKYVYINMIC